MTILIPKPAISRQRKALALAVAVIADVIQIGLFPVFAWGAASPAQDLLDVIISLILLAIVGFRWQLAAAFAIELIPGLDMFPTWAAFILTIPSEPAHVTASTVSAPPVVAPPRQMPPPVVSPGDDVIDVEVVEPPRAK